MAVSSKPVDAAIGLQTRTYGYLSKINKSELRVICNYLDAFPDEDRPEACITKGKCPCATPEK